MTKFPWGEVNFWRCKTSVNTCEQQWTYSLCRITWSHLSSFTKRLLSHWIKYLKIGGYHLTNITSCDTFSLSHDWSKCIRQSHMPQLKLWNIGEYSSSNILQFQTLLLIREESLYINCGVILDTVLYLIPNFFSVLTCESWSWTLQKFHIYKHLLIILWLF